MTALLAVAATWLVLAIAAAAIFGAVLGRARPTEPTSLLYEACPHGVQVLDTCPDCPGGIPATDTPADRCSDDICPHPDHWGSVNDHG